jgi:hypothetical protein
MPMVHKLGTDSVMHSARMDGKLARQRFFFIFFFDCGRQKRTWGFVGVSGLMWVDSSLGS